MKLERHSYGYAFTRVGYGMIGWYHAEIKKGYVNDNNTKYLGYHLFLNDIRFYI